MVGLECTFVLVIEMEPALEAPARLVAIDDGDEGLFSCRSVEAAGDQPLDDRIRQPPKFVLSPEPEVLSDRVVQQFARDLVPIRGARLLEALALLALILALLPQPLLAASTSTSCHPGLPVRHHCRAGMVACSLASHKRR